MFVVTLNRTRLRQIGVGVMCCAMVVCSALLGRYISNQTVAAAAGTGGKIESAQDIQTWFTGYGIEVDGASISADKVSVVRTDRQGGVDIGIGLREVILFRPFLRDLHAIDDHVIAACVHTRQEAVPFAFHEYRLHSQVLRDLSGHLHVKARKLVCVVMEGPGGPGPLRCHDQLASFLDLGQGILPGSLLSGSCSGRGSVFRFCAATCA